MNSPALKFGSKADTLIALGEGLRSARVLSVFAFTSDEFFSNPAQITHQIQQSFPRKIILRSSAVNEDSQESSHAGEFCSIADIDVSNPAAIQQAIEKVFDSYPQKLPRIRSSAQAMLENIAVAGVAFTADILTLAPYDIINFDRSGSSDSITSGSGKKHETYVRFKDAPTPIEEPFLEKLICALRELETLFSNPALDVEFAIDQSGELYIFQVRPIVTQGRAIPESQQLSKLIHKTFRKVKKLASEHPNLLGERAIFGIMPDWNPAEIIGKETQETQPDALQGIHHRSHLGVSA